MNATALAPRHLGRRSPPAGWEGYFLIGIFPAGSALRWCKIQFFSGGRAPGRWCLSAVEGMNGPGAETVLLGREDGVERHERALAPEEFVRAERRFELRTPHIRWGGAFPDLDLVCDLPSVRARARAREALFWARIPGLLTYWSAFGTLAIETAGERAAGVGVVEHAWGAQLPIDASPLLPRAWHWDVLAVGEGAALAGLAVGRAGSLRALPGARGAAIRVLEWIEVDDRRVPARWRGRLRTRGGHLDYEARAATPVAPVVTGGGFLGFTWEGELREGDATARPRAGAGFCEYRAG